jgi:hypothetical protein
MAARAAHGGPRLLEGPMLLWRTRRDLTELAALVWLGVEIIRLVRSRLEKARTR